MGAFRKIGKVFQRSPVIIETIPATSPVEPVLAERLHRTGFYALAAFLAGFEQTGFLGIDQRMVSQLNLTH
jgi:hypothetical protein